MLFSSLLTSTVFWIWTWPYSFESVLVKMISRLTLCKLSSFIAGQVQADWQQRAWSITMADNFGPKTFFWMSSILSWMWSISASIWVVSCIFSLIQVLSSGTTIFSRRILVLSENQFEFDKCLQMNSDNPMKNRRGWRIWKRISFDSIGHWWTIAGNVK